MKRGLVIFFLFIANYAIAQSFEAKITVKVRANSNGSYGGGCRNHIIVNLIFDDGDSREIIPLKDLNDVGRLDYVTYTGSTTFSKKKVVQIETITSRNWDRLIGGCGGDGSFNNESEKHNVSSYCTTSLTDIAPWWDVNSVLEVIPIIELDQSRETNIGYDKSFDLSVKPNSNMYTDSTYNWEYHIEGNKDSIYIRPFFGPGYWRYYNIWRKMPSWTDGEKNFSITPKEFLEGTFSPKDVINKKISFRINTCDNNYTDVITYTIRKAAPSITTTKSFQSTCYGMSDAYVRVYFERQLEPKESISYVLYDTDKDAGTEGGITYFVPTANGNNIGNFLIEPNTGKYYLDVTGIPSSKNYKFEIIGFDKNNNSKTSEFRPDSGSVTNSSYEGAVLYTGDGTYSANIVIPETPPVEFTAIKTQDIICNGSADGKVQLSAKGGLSGKTYQYKMYDDKGGVIINWTSFTSGANHTVTIDKGGKYRFFVKNSDDCDALKRKTDGTISTDVDFQEITINEPLVLTSAVNNVEIKKPTAFGFTDGIISVKTSGGNHNNIGYSIVWYKDNVLMSSPSINSLKEGRDDTFIYTERLLNIGAGTYKAVITDAKGCTTSVEYVLDQPEPLELNVSVEKPISCNNNSTSNFFKAEDGKLKAVASGGVGKYVFTWMKRENGIWKVVYTSTRLDGESTYPAGVYEGIGEGEYAVNIEDENKIVLGKYNNNILEQELPEEITLKEPEPIVLSFTTTEVSCSIGNDGTAGVEITGGTPPYDVTWSNGATTSEIKDLIGGVYFVYVTDSLGCEVIGNVEVSQPKDIDFSIVTQKNPTCIQASDGAITVNVTGGVPPYDYLWNTGANTNSITNVPAGTYILQIIDSRNCVAYKEVILEDPAPVLIDLGKDRTLCTGQEFSLDVTIDDPKATYQWESDNGFTSRDSQVTLNKAGVYTVTVTTAAGCIGQDQINVKESDTVIDADFLITSQAFVYEEVVIANVSNPLGEKTEWYVPNGVTIISESSEAIILKFREVGSYEIRLRTIEGDCYQDYTKQIVVEEPIELYDIGEAEEPFLKKFMIHPNPNDGNFSVDIELSERADIALRLISLITANVADRRAVTGQDSYSIPYNLSLASGTYILLLETPKGNEVRRVIIK